MDGRVRAKQAGIVPDNPLHSRHPWRSDARAEGNAWSNCRGGQSRNPRRRRWRTQPFANAIFSPTQNKATLRATRVVAIHIIVDDLLKLRGNIVTA